MKNTTNKNIILNNYNKHKNSLTTIEEERFREDPVYFHGFCFFPIQLKASKLVTIIFTIETFYLSICTIHLLPIQDRFELVIQLVYCLGIGLDFIISLIKIILINFRRVSIKCSLLDKISSKLWMITRSILFLWDICVTTYILFLTHTNNKYQVVSFIMIYFDLLLAIYMLSMGFYLNVSFKRLISRSQWSIYSETEKSNRYNCFDSQQNFNTPNQLSCNFSSNSKSNSLKVIKAKKNKKKNSCKEFNLKKVNENAYKCFSGKKKEDPLHRENSSSVQIFNEIERSNELFGNLDLESSFNCK